MTRKDKVNLKITRICSEHLMKIYSVHDDKNRLLGSSPKRKGKDSAVAHVKLLPLNTDEQISENWKSKKE